MFFQQYKSNFKKKENENLTRVQLLFYSYEKAWPWRMSDLVIIFNQKLINQQSVPWLA